MLCYVIRRVDMNFNIYINKTTGEKITKLAKKMHRSRNSIVNEALEQWLTSHTPTKWPAHFFEFSPITDVPDFKEMRKEFKEISEDPLT